MDVVPQFVVSGCKVIDLGGDFRLKDPQEFVSWYAKPHTHTELLGKAVYGITELNRDAIAKASLIANPGCYATSVILAAAPLMGSGLVEPGSVIVDAKSGLTGAGRKCNQPLLFAEMNENAWPYKVHQHQHVPEVVQALRPFSQGETPAFTFVPHVIPVNRGILSTIYFRLRKKTDWSQVQQLYASFYKNAPFVRLRDKQQWPQIREVVGSNYCDIAWSVDQGQNILVVTAAIDNLMNQEMKSTLEGNFLPGQTADVFFEEAP